MAESDEAITTTVRFYNVENVAMQVVGHGLKPLILIEMDTPDEKVLHFDIQATGPHDQYDLADFLELVIDVLRKGVPPEPDADQPDPNNN